MQLAECTFIPNQLTNISVDFITTPPSNNFLRGCKWSPDGSCLLASSNDKCMRIFELDLILDTNRDTKSPLAALVLPEPEIIYDYAWYPGMSSCAPLTCCLASACRDCPVHLWDAYTGLVRCSYVPYNHVQEIHAPYSLCFSPNGDYIICGMKHHIKYFNTAIPGSQYTDIQLANGKKQVPNNIVSTLATHANSGIVFGTFGGNIGLVGENEKVEILFQAHPEGVTHIELTVDGNYLVAGGRKNNNILIWDLRNPTHIFAKLLRISPTSQRIYFNIDHTSNQITSGNQDGKVSIWSENTWKSNRENTNEISPDFDFKAHEDSVNGVSVHPSKDFVASASGEKKFWVSFNSEFGEEEMLNAPSENCIKIWNGLVPNNSMQTN